MLSEHDVNLEQEHPHPTVVPEGDIRMQNAKEPLTNEGFTLVFRGVKMSE